MHEFICCSERPQSALSSHDLLPEPNQVLANALYICLPNTSLHFNTLTLTLKRPQHPPTLLDILTSTDVAVTSTDLSLTLFESTHADEMDNAETSTTTALPETILIR